MIQLDCKDCVAILWRDMIIRVLAKRLQKSTQVNIVITNLHSYSYLSVIQHYKLTLH